MNGKTHQPLQGPLREMRVLDLAGPPGVYCGKLMAGMGADVIKVEPPGGDPMRNEPPFLKQASAPFFNKREAPGHSLAWLHFNAGKRSVTLDVSTPRGATLLRRLAQKADVLLETFSPGFLDALDLGYDSLSSPNPGLIHVSITPFGQTGPYRDYASSDLVAFAMGGYMYVTGWPHTPPTRLWGSQAYHASSNRAFIAALTAIYHRTNTGEGQHVDVSIQESVAATTEHVNMSYLYGGEVAVRCGFRHGGQFVATWRCRDGYASITTNTQKAWDDLRAWMAEDGMVGDLLDEKYDSLFVLRGDQSAHIEELIERWTMTHTRAEITQRGQAAHHPWGPAVTPEELLDNPQLRARGFLTDVEHPELPSFNKKGLTHPGAPYLLPRSPWALGTDAPGPGRHNAQVYQDELGLSPGEVEDLARARVV